MVSLFNFVIGISADPTLPRGACTWPQAWFKDFSNLLDIVWWAFGRGLPVEMVSSIDVK